MAATEDAKGEAFEELVCYLEPTGLWILITGQFKVLKHSAHRGSFLVSSADPGCYFISL